MSSLSNSADNSANDGIDDEDFAFDYNASQLFKYQRPGSRALSVPAPMTNPFGKGLLMVPPRNIFIKDIRRRLH